MREDAQKLAAILRGRRRVRVVTHIDADGICAGAVASLALDRAGVENSVEFVKQLDPKTVARVRDDGALLWFTDLGSGSLEMLEGIDCVISDHHTPSDKAQGAGRTAQGTGAPTVNPHLHGLSGATELSGAGAAYLVARELCGANRDLSALAIVGAVGDLQDAQHCRLTGLNRELLEDGRAAGVLGWHIDLRYFGRETRPVHKMLQYSSDPAIPGITGSEQGALDFLASLGLRLKSGEEWRSWSLLDDAEKRLVASRLVEHLLSSGTGHRMALRLLGEVYTLLNERGGTPLRDAKEFSTLLNSCGRHDRPRLGLEVCRGDRGDAYRRALSLLQDHRRSLVEGIQLVSELGIRRTGHLQWFDAGDGIQDTLVGVVAGMLLGSGESGADPALPVFAFARAEDGSGVKVSARAARALVDRGLDLSAVMREASAAVGGSGGGHNVAAGGLIPEGARDRFLEAAERVLRDQLAGA
ncbi:MAG: DHH family phosphoesterase [Euryarchaeota archaeon]|nr:DHH family phosphoesterase [Euryarchaeota archaeon]